MTFTKSLTASRVLSWILVACVAVGSAFLAGCASSEESTEWEKVPPPQPRMTEALEKTIDSLQTNATQLKAQLNKSETEKRTLTAKIAEMEMKLSEVKEQPAPRPVSNPAVEYDRGLALFRQRSYQEAASTFMGMLNSGVAGEVESNFHYWIGESYYGMRQYADAITYFERVFGFKKTTKKDDAQIMIANSYFMMGDKGRAKKEYQKLIDQYPASPYVKRAKEKLAKL
jgi:TolA-binding protein